MTSTLGQPPVGLSERIDKKVTRNVVFKPLANFVEKLTNSSHEKHGMSEFRTLFRLFSRFRGKV